LAALAQWSLMDLGATNADSTRGRGLTGKRHYRRMLQA